LTEEIKVDLSIFEQAFLNVPVFNFTGLFWVLKEMKNKCNIKQEKENE